MNRSLIFGIPLVALGVASWAAWQVHRASPARAEAVVMMLPGEIPALNPFLPTSEAERQLLDLLHEPLIRVDGQGRLSPGLAESWAWHQRVTCWFPTAEALQAAQRKLAEIPLSQRQAWALEEVTTEGLTLILRFAKPGSPGTDEALQALATDALLPLTFLRLDSQPASRSVLEAFAADPAHAPGIVRLWFDEDGTCELVTTRPLLQVRDAVATWLLDHGQPVPRMTPLAEVAGLLEPVLDLELNNRHSWPDSAPVTAADVRATVAHAMRLGYPIPGREGFRHIQEIKAQGSNTVRVTYRRSYGAALASWVGFPILPAAWLEKHPDSTPTPLPGAGAWQVTRQSTQHLTLTSRKPGEGSQPTRLEVLTTTPALQTRVALATGTLDVVWPNEKSDLQQETTLDFHPTPPRNRLLVLWNLRSSRLSELPVREALLLGLDRPHLLPQTARMRLAEPLFAPGLWYSPAPATTVFDPKAAQEKLESAGWLKDVSGVAKKGGQALEFQLLVTTGNALRDALAQELARQWAQLGARVTVSSVAPENLLPDHLSPGKFDAVLLGLDYELAWDQTAFWHSGQVGAGLNFGRLADPQLDLLLEALAGEFDTSQLPLRARALQERFLSQQPVLPLIGDLQEIAIRRARFPQLEGSDLNRPLTLRRLLRASPLESLEMRPPNE